MFRMGQKVVCINGAGWVKSNGRYSTGPKINEELLINGFDDGFLIFKEYNQDESFLPSSFRPRKPELSTTTFDEIINGITIIDTSKTN